MVGDDEINRALPDRFFAWYHELSFTIMDDKARSFIESAEREQGVYNYGETLSRGVMIAWFGAIYECNFELKFFCTTIFGRWDNAKNSTVENRENTSSIFFLTVLSQEVFDRKIL